MLNQVLADLIVVLHLGFCVFAVLGGLLTLRWRWCVWVHGPAALWAVLIEFAGWVCPLTPLENRLRQSAGAAGYSTGFVEHYLLPILYPTALTRPLQILLGVLVLVANVAIYGWVWRSSRRNAGATRLSPGTAPPGVAR